ncbi:DUF899 domain-containing protein [Paracoccus aurantiacus]|uniref:DUF899 domain-containing protein n=1 Tax=Paracoccus aurantiacus TaxID=2599412 RepID=A0A5C6S494_9RHOB|nr:DUF899 family protein [Paracoccus aurantiacus]TXB69648.1 DUF899 domain-containing protein [Paracoccus aurantiacus]
MTELKPAKELAELREQKLPGESAEYTAARKALLAEEIEFRRHKERVAQMRRDLPPGPVVEKDYRFITADGAEVGLIDLFGDHDTLITYFWMYGPERQNPCPMCVNWIGGMEGNVPDITQRVAYRVLSRGPVERMTQFAKDRGWQHTEFAQTVGDDFIADLTGLDKDSCYDVPLTVVWRREGDKARHFYVGAIPDEAADPGQDPRMFDIAPLWNLLDFTPEGRGTDWYPKLNYED